MKQLFLIGYEKESLTQFVNKLEKNKVKIVFDVRKIPVSRKNGFSKNTLKNKLSKKNIHYYSFTELGSPTVLRKMLRRTSDYINFFKSYRKYLLNQNDSLNEIIELIINNENDSAILCYERNSDLCHRSIIASEILKMNQNIKIIPL